MNKLIMVGEDKLTTKQYKERVTFLLNEALEYGLVEYLNVLESLFDKVDSVKLYTIECAIGDYIYLNRKAGV